MLNRLSILVFSKNRPLFLDTHLETLAPTVLRGNVDVTVYFMATSEEMLTVTPNEMLAAYTEISQKYPWARFIQQKRAEELSPFWNAWARDSAKYHMVTMDDNLHYGEIDVETIFNTLEDESIFGFTLRLHPGIRHTVSAGFDDAGPKPELGKKVIIYNPLKYDVPWSFVWEMSSTVFRKDALLKVLSTQTVNTVGEVEVMGYRLFNGIINKMACFSWAPVTNIYVDSLFGYSAVANPVPNEIAFRMYRRGDKIDVEKTFKCRDEQSTTHVKELFLKTRDNLVAIEKTESIWEKFAFQFDEEGYLKMNEDVRQGVIRGEFISGWEHFIMFGYKESSRWVNPPEIRQLVLDVWKTIYYFMIRKKLVQL